MNTIITGEFLLIFIQIDSSAGHSTSSFFPKTIFLFDLIINKKIEN